MKDKKHIHAPLDDKVIATLKSGEEVLLSGTIYTARDQAHLRFFNSLQRGKKLPMRLEGEIIYYCGPTPARKGEIIGSCGPTTSSRMDRFTPALLARGLKGMIGKGRRSKEVTAAIKRAGAVYFAAPAGAGAYLSEKIVSSKVVLFPELEPEAVYKLEVKNFPLIVVIDSKGKNLYKKFEIRNPKSEK